MKRAVEAAGIDPPISFYGLRHTYCSHAIMAGVPMLVVANNVGHADTRMIEKHYGHLAPSYARQQIQAGMPSWNISEACLDSTNNCNAFPVLAGGQ